MERECSLWTPFWNVCHVDMAIGMTPVHLQCSYIVHEEGKCGEGKPLYVSHDDRKVELCLVCWLGKDREEVNACVLLKCFGR